ncbi:alpha/beta hydrolase [Reichenbachiella agarivorans]|uniref:Alpha/beta hydrolase n=1 Tax=Reichenbachiella agarivorans TaxID=2979464 RepID=A0ABY6CWC6_9BACT|nr:alpha/beta hydrolase [Reichenbachiella agarivorans]UXP32550.1 alpha/beta hydrolase [Reichenbachiella agarivorans]
MTRKNKKLKKKIKSILLASLLATCIVLCYLLFFFVSNKAPILQGTVEYQLEYKPGLHLDLYRPTNQVYTISPVLVYFHGGAWVLGRKEAININRFNDAINTLRENGYTIVSPAYTLAHEGKSPFPACIIDGFDALKWIKTHAQQYNLDLDNVNLMGESAGAQIAMMLSYSDPYDFGIDHSMPTIRSVVDIYGPSDLQSLYYSQSIDSLQSLLAKVPGSIAKNLDITQQICGFDPKSDSLRAQEFMAKYSPVRYITSQASPTLIIQGDADIIVPHSQSEILNQRLTDFGVDHAYYSLEGMGHALRLATDAQKDSMQIWIPDFVMKHRYADNKKQEGK